MQIHELLGKRWWALLMRHGIRDASHMLKNVHSLRSSMASMDPDVVVEVFSELCGSATISDPTSKGMDVYLTGNLAAWVEAGGREQAPPPFQQPCAATCVSSMWSSPAVC